MDLSCTPKNYRQRLAAVVLTLAGCTEEAPPVPQQLPPEPTPKEAPDPYVHSPSRFGLVPLHAGFSPDPRVVGGTAVGEVSARSVHRKCKGWVSETPDYLVDMDTAFFLLHIMGRSRSDVLLVVRKPNGTVLCNDNRNGTKDPMVSSDFPIGTTQVWVGVKKKGMAVDYKLGFSEVKWRSSSIPLPDED